MTDRYADFPDWILGITREIWEDRGLGARMRECYGADAIVRTPAGIGRGEPAMTAATMATMVELPDRQLMGEDVIWCEAEGGGRFSSHRIVSVATHTGGGVLTGPPTGRRVTYRAIADCYADGGKITDEWLVRDNGAIVRQLGVEPRDWAAAAVAAGRAEAFTLDLDAPGPYGGRGDPGEWGERYADLLTRIMGAELSVIPANWDRACHLLYPGGVTAHGWDSADRFWLPLRSAFPSAAFAVDHVIGRGDDPMMPPRAAVRWSLTGRHEGWGPFGPPTGAPVHVMGICHAEFGPFRGGRHAPGEWSVRREWVLMDETAIWVQILRHAG